jgi:hypothetical protein
MPIHMCPGVPLAVREDKPFMQFFRGFLKSAPLVPLHVDFWPTQKA